MRALAFHLPQFQPTRANDRWWGRGFTEWTSVSAATPRFLGHEQPHLPADLGFYDLRLPDARAAQAELAARFDVEGFVHYHYWLGGQRLLDGPLRAVLQDPEAHPFALCWANHHWTRAWDGRSGEVLVEQVYGADDDVRHLRLLAEAWSHPRHLTVGGRPLFLVTQASDLPDPAATVDRWRTEASRLGVADPYLVRVELMAGDRTDPTPAGFDATVLFPPIGIGRPETLLDTARTEAARRGDIVAAYDAMVDAVLARPEVAWRRHPCVVPRWDNTPRRATKALVFHGSTPAGYRRWLEGEIARARPTGADDDLLFVNAWNEWAEGAHLEPCQRWGLGYLEAHLALPSLLRS